MVALVGHVGIAFAGLAGVIVDHASAGTIVTAWIGGHLGIAGLHNASTAATERAQAQSPNYPLPPQPPIEAPPSAGPGVTLKPPS